MVLFKKAKETPAEQLLRMIEGPQHAPETAAGPSPSPVSPASMLKRLVEQGQARAAMAWRALLPSRREVDPFLWNVRLAHRVAWIALVALAAFGTYTLVDVVMTPPKPRSARILMPSLAPFGESGSTEPAASPSTLKALADYLGMAQRRNPFTGQVPGQERPSSKTTKRHLEEVAQGLSVVGIDRGPNPVALIENTAQQKTYMVKVGDELNGMVVQSIGPEGVTLTYEGQEFLLQ